MFALDSSKGPKRRMGRRKALAKGAAAIGGIAVIRSLDLLPGGSGAPRASAAVGTEWSSCGSYDSDYEREAKAGSSRPCWGTPHISQVYCGTDKWFKNASGTCYVQYAINICNTGGGNRNAWRWTHNGTPYRCADGMVQNCGGGSALVICSAPNP